MIPVPHRLRHHRRRRAAVGRRHRRNRQVKAARPDLEVRGIGNDGRKPGGGSAGPQVRQMPAVWKHPVRQAGSSMSSLPDPGRHLLAGGPGTGRAEHRLEQLEENAGGRSVKCPPLNGDKPFSAPWGDEKAVPAIPRGSTCAQKHRGNANVISPHNAGINRLRKRIDREQDPRDLHGNQPHSTSTAAGSMLPPTRETHFPTGATGHRKSAGPAAGQPSPHGESTHRTLRKSRSHWAPPRGDQPPRLL